MRRWLIAIAIFAACEAVLLLAGVGLWALVHDWISAILVLLLPCAFAIWISGKLAPRVTT